MTVAAATAQPVTAAVDLRRARAAEAVFMSAANISIPSTTQNQECGTAVREIWSTEPAVTVRRVTVPAPVLAPLLPSPVHHPALPPPDPAEAPSPPAEMAYATTAKSVTTAMYGMETAVTASVRTKQLLPAATAEWSQARIVMMATDNPETAAPPHAQESSSTLPVETVSSNHRRNVTILIHSIPMDATAPAASNASQVLAVHRVSCVETVFLNPEKPVMMAIG